MKRNLKRVRQIFLRAQVLDMKALVVRFPGRSQRSLFRDLTALGYRSSYTHGGGFYTLTEIPDFDEWKAALAAKRAVYSIPCGVLPP